MRQEPEEVDEEVIRYIRQEYRWSILFVATGSLSIACGLLYSMITVMRVPSANLRHACLAVFFVTFGYVIIKKSLVYRKLFQMLNGMANKEEGIECIRQLAIRSESFRKVGMGCIALGPLLGGGMYWLTRDPDAGLIMAGWFVVMGGGLSWNAKQSSKIYPLIEKRIARVE